jgi:hypothetical protein
MSWLDGDEAVGTNGKPSKLPILDQKDALMTSSRNTIATLMAAAGVATVLVTGAATSPAAAKHAHHARTNHAAYHARAQALPRYERRQRRGGGWFAHGERDNPPGAAFEDYGEDQSLGMVR